VITHEAPDGDAIGSLSGMGLALAKLGKEHCLACPDPVPKSFLYLPRSECIVDLPEGDYDLVIGLDCNDLKRFGKSYDDRALSGVPIVNIDHHVTNTSFGTINWVDIKASSTSEMVLELLEHLGIPIDKPLATCLLSGIVSDTIGFRTIKTTKKTLETAIKLMEAGANLPEITERVLNLRPLSALRLWAKALSNIHLDGEIIWVEVTKGMREECDFSERNDAGLANLLATVEEAEIAIVFNEIKEGRVEVGIRARKGIDVSEIALRLGGGGHPQAAGCFLEGEIETVKEKVLSEIRGRHGEKLQNLRHT